MGLYLSLLDNHYFDDIIVSQKDGEDFIIFDTHDDVNALVYGIIKALIPSAIDIYEKAGLVKNHYGYAKVLSSLKIDGEYPEEVKNYFDKHGIDDFNIIEKTLDIHDWGFSDEYGTCSNCGDVIRIAPDSYMWQPEYFLNRYGEAFCKDCLSEDDSLKEDMLDELINNPSNAINGMMTEKEVEDMGFIKHNGVYQDGWYGREDDPQKIYDELSKKYKEVLFMVDSINQFHINFVVFVRGEI